MINPNDLIVLILIIITAPIIAALIRRARPYEEPGYTSHLDRSAFQQKRPSDHAKEKAQLKALDIEYEPERPYPIELPVDLLYSPFQGSTQMSALTATTRNGDSDFDLFRFEPKRWSAELHFEKQDTNKQLKDDKLFFNKVNIKTSQDTCVICKLDIGDADTMSCSHCKAKGHEHHFKEWIKMKGTCPLCKKRLIF